MRTFLAVAIFLGASVAASAGPTIADADARVAKDGLELYYLGNKAYDPVVCRRVDHDGSPYILCRHPFMDPDAGALWTVAPGLKLIPVNGKAIGQVRKFGDHITKLDGSPIAVGKWADVAPGTVPDIRPILEEFK